MYCKISHELLRSHRFPLQNQVHCNICLLYTSVSVVSFSSVLEAFCSCLRRCRSCRNCVAVSSTSDVSMESASRSSGRPSSDSSSSVSNCVKFENRVSNSSGDSTFVMMTTIFSEESGIDVYKRQVQRHSVCTVEKKVQILLYIRTWLGCRWNCCSERRTTDD